MKIINARKSRIVLKDYNTLTQKFKLNQSPHAYVCVSRKK